MSFDYSSHLTAVVAAEALESAPGGGPPAQHACLDCGAALTDRFCAHCGQPADTHRITLKHLLLHDLPHSVWHVDKGLAFTFWQMLTRPGLTIRGYLAGQRTRQFRPVSYLLLLVGLAALVMSAFQANLQQATLAAQSTGAGSPSQGLMAMAIERYFSIVMKHPSLMQLVLLPLNALVAWRLLRRAGYNYAEVLLANAFIVRHLHRFQPGHPAARAAGGQFGICAAGFAARFYPDAGVPALGKRATAAGRPRAHGGAALRPGTGHFPAANRGGAAGGGGVRRRAHVPGTARAARFEAPPSAEKVADGRPALAAQNYSL